MKRVRCLLVLLLAACTAPYRPARAVLPTPLPADAFARVRDAVAARYPVLEVIDEKGFRIRSAWVPHLHGEVPGQRRATVFLDPPNRLGIVVETRYLRLGFFGSPSWGASHGDRGLERELEDAVAVAMR